EGEWKVRQHGWSKHRTWRKLHLGVDESTGDILLGEVTGNDAADSELLAPLLSQLPEPTVVHQVSTDGAYDRRSCYGALRTRHIACVAIPPRHGARIWQHGNTHAERLARDENLRRIRMVGRQRWKDEINYHRRSLAETTMFRLKTIFGDKVTARTFVRQRIQLLLRCKALNLMTTLGMPKSELVVA
ncbi:MAG: IS5 family transposase, partial [Candidatus Kerfeldbacteria bacterium]|nr:IS5 family transposase [Candidatus Kerfeldbacteria bacterium]